MWQVPDYSSSSHFKDSIKMALWSSGLHFCDNRSHDLYKSRSSIPWGCNIFLPLRRALDFTSPKSLESPQGVLGSPQRFLKLLREFSRTPQGVLRESLGNSQGLLRESLGSPQGILRLLKDSSRSPQGILALLRDSSGTPWTPQRFRGFPRNSLESPQRILRDSSKSSHSPPGVLRQSSDSSWSPWGILEKAW